MLTQIQTYEQMPLLTYSLAVFYETLRMFPPVSISRIQEVRCTCVTFRQVTGIPKMSAEDTSLVTSNIHGEKCTIPIPKDVDVTICVPGLHYNRQAAYLPYHVIISSYLISNFSSLLGGSPCLQTFPLPRRLAPRRIFTF